MSVLKSEFEQILDEHGEVQVIPAQELVRQVKVRIREIEARIEKQKQIDECRKENLRLKKKKEGEILQCRRFNLEQKAKKSMPVIKGLIAGINLKGSVR